MGAGKHADSRYFATALPPMKAAGTSLAVDNHLSAAFERALGAVPAEAHPSISSRKTGQEIAQRARAEKPTFLTKGTPRAHIGPRSGHK